MPTANIRGVALVYETHGSAGPWISISPGGRRGLVSVKPLARLIADAGYRVLIHDRRNTGASGIAFGGDSESVEQAEDQLALMRHVGIAGPSYVCGCSSGARLSLTLAMRHPEAVKALLLWRVTGGEYAAKKLAFNYYEQFIAAAQKGGMDAVCETEHFAAMIKANPRNRETLQAMGAERFVAAMQRWLAGYHRGSSHPISGVPPEAMREMTFPAIVVPGNDFIHPRTPGQVAHRLLPRSRYAEIFSHDVEVDVDFAAWDAKDPTLAAIFIDFLRDCEAGRA
jgi:pimeloyl-ACP methyl ester carboxylesterase